jgi:hypothetical protein
MINDPSIALAVNARLADRFLQNLRPSDWRYCAADAAREAVESRLVETEPTTPAGASMQLRTAARWLDDGVEEDLGERLLKIARRVGRGERGLEIRSELRAMALALDEADVGGDALAMTYNVVEYLGEPALS